MQRLPTSIAFAFAAISILAYGCASPAEKKYTGKSIAITDSVLIHGGADTLRLSSIFQREVVQKSFRLVNATENPVVLLGYDTTCGCTQLIYDRKVLNPHEYCDMTCRYDSAGEYGWTMTVVSLRIAGADKTFDIFVECEVK